MGRDNRYLDSDSEEKLKTQRVEVYVFSFQVPCFVRGEITETSEYSLRINRVSKKQYHWDRYFSRD